MSTNVLTTQGPSSPIAPPSERTTQGERRGCTQVTAKLGGGAKEDEGVQEGRTVHVF